MRNTSCKERLRARRLRGYWPAAARMAALSSMAAALSLSGCSTINGYLDPVPSYAAAPGTTHVEMVVATNRTRAPSAAIMFSGGRALGMDFADMVVSMPPDADRQIGQIQFPKQLPGDPEVDFVTLKAQLIVKNDAIAAFGRLLSESHKSEALVFVHGFNQRYDDAVYRFAQILHDSGAESEVAPVLFTWPSKGNVFAYGYDRESANYSRDALEELLRYLVKDPQVKTISILAHSMGNWVALEALRQMAIRDGRVAAKIKLVLLAAPDVDVDNAREQIAAMGPNRPHFALFLSQDDRALAASRRLWGAPRLGAIDPDVEPYKSMLEQEKISVINLTNLPSHDEFNHGKFAEDPRVVELIGRSLASGQILTDSRVGVGEQIMQTTASAAGSVGRAAGLVVSAPLAVIDQETHDHYADQLDQFSQSVQQIGPEYPH
jgi:esterase/lipase superfamily enzyme